MDSSSQVHGASKTMILTAPLSRSLNRQQPAYADLAKDSGSRHSARSGSVVDGSGSTTLNDPSVLMASQTSWWSLCSPVANRHSDPAQERTMMLEPRTAATPP